MSGLKSARLNPNNLLNQQIDDLENLMIVLRHHAERDIKWNWSYDQTKSDGLKTAFLSVVSRVDCLGVAGLGENGLRSRALNLYNDYYSSLRIHYNKHGRKIADPPVIRDSVSSIQHWPEAEVIARVMMERLVDSENIAAYGNIKQFYDKAAKSFGLKEPLSITPKANRQIM
jgi:hypothetical protein